MKKIIQFLILLFMFVCNSNAQVVVTGSLGTANGTYSKLGDAFDALNLVDVQAGANINITINADGYFAASETSGCMLEQPSKSNWNSLAIRSVGAVIISKKNTAGGNFPMIDLNGTDKVTIDGLNSGINSLTIYPFSSDRSTIILRRDATNNVITNCTVLGSTTDQNEGTIYFGANAFSTGNDSNIISNCNIGPAGSSLPANAIYSEGSDNSTERYNSDNKITGCNIFDYFSSASSAGIHLSSGSTDWIITNNKFYQTTARTNFGSGIHSAILFESQSINNCLIAGNTIGFSSSLGTGFYDLTGGTNSKFYPICIFHHGTVTQTNVQGNIIKNIKLSGQFFGEGYNTPFAAIYVVNGRVDIGNLIGNTIGSSTSNGSIQFSTLSNPVEVYGIYHQIQYLTSKNISNNNIGGITLIQTNSNQLSFCGIRTNSANSTDTIVNNTIGYSDARIELSTQFNSNSRVVGIFSQGYESIVKLNNISSLISDAGNTGTYLDASVIGIFVWGFEATISQNSIVGLTNTNPNSAVSVIGFTQNCRGKVEKNIIRSLNISSSDTLATINGIYDVGLYSTYQNNFISLGFDIHGASITKNISINGMNILNGGTSNFYHNSVYIGGAGVLNSTTNTYAFVNSGYSNAEIYNNIFYNARSNNSGFAKHYAIGFFTSTPITNLNNNLYFCSGAGGKMGSYNGIDILTLADWQNPLIGPGQDTNSFFGNPRFIDPPNDLHINSAIPTFAEGNGTFIPTVSDDYDGQIRSVLTPVDLGADAGNFTISEGCDSVRICAKTLCGTDEYTMCIANSSPPYDIVQCVEVYPEAQGCAYFKFSNAMRWQSYYITVRTDNSLETWSAVPMIIIGDKCFEYDFTTDSSKAFGKNMKKINGVWTLYSGDIDHNGFIDLLDVLAIYNDGTQFITGVTDLNCDNYTDLSDVLIAYNNSVNFVKVKKP